MIIVVVVLAIVSVALSFWSLRGLNNSRETHELKKELSRNRVVFHKDSSSS